MRFAAALTILGVSLVAAPSATADSMSYLDNGVIRLGVDLSKGGTITYLSTSGAGVNVVNSWDLGREVQQSYYAGPVNFGNPAPPWTNFPWNPIGAGDTYRNAATVILQSNDGKTIYTKTAPLQWALQNVPCECLIEQSITLDGNSAHVHNRLTNNRSDSTVYAAMGQELPAVYTNGTFWRLFTYNGSAPYTNGQVTQIFGVLPNASQFSATEHWAALVNDSGFGLGIFNSFATHFFGGFAGTPNIGGPSDNPTGYIAPNLSEILDWNIVYEYDYALVLGTLDQIRSYAVAQKPDDRPNYEFAHDRQHFFLVNATDNGWPISTALRINLGQNDPYIVGPEQWWQASEVPRLYVRAAYHTSGTSAQIFWSVPGQDISQERSIRFTAIPDGAYHTYTADLSASPAYQGTITGIRFDPSDGNDPGGYVDIASITWRSSDPGSGANYQGLWWNSPAQSESGWGINFAHQGDVIFATWFTYDINGKAWWLTMTATKTAEGVYSGQLIRTNATPFSAFVPPATVTVVGTAAVTFTSPTTGTLTYMVNDGANVASQTKAIELQTFGPVPTCVWGGQTDLTKATNYQDLWWAAGGVESGWGINLTQQGTTIFATWFTYDANHNPLWLSVTALQTAPGVYSGTLLRTGGPAFSSVPFDPTKVTRLEVGTTTFTFTDGNHGVFNYSVDLGDGVNKATQTKAITRQVFSAPGTTCQ